MAKTTYNPEKLNRKVFDHYCDKQTAKLGRYRQRQLEIEKKVTLILKFLEVSPHAAAWKIFIENEEKKG